jgi:hypothetical protein
MAGGAAEAGGAAGKARDPLKRQRKRSRGPSAAHEVMARGKQ